MLRKKYTGSKSIVQTLDEDVICSELTITTVERPCSARAQLPVQSQQ